MSSAKLKIKFGDPQNCQKPSTFSITTYLQQQNINQHQEVLSKKIGKFRLPMIVVQTSEDLKQIDLNKFSTILSQNFDNQSIIRDKKLYQLFELKNTEWKSPVKKIQNLLKNVTTCSSNFQLKMTFDNLLEKNEGIKRDNSTFASSFLENAHIEANIGLDSNFISTLTQIIDPISPGFSQSPLIAFLELFGDLEAQFEFQSPSVLNPRFASDCSKKLIAFSSPNEQEKATVLQELGKSKEQINIYIHFGKVGYVHLKGEAIIWSYLLCLI